MEREASSRASMRLDGPPMPRRDLAAWLVLCAATVYLARPFGASLPVAGLDPSWMLAVNRADDLGLRFGRDLVFTYGPWAWLTAPVVLDAETVVGAGLFTTVAVVTLWTALAAGLAGSRRGLGAAAGASLLTLLVLAVAGPSWSLVLGLFAWVLHRLLARAEPSVLLTCAVSVSAGLLVMVKVSEGVLATALAVGTVLAFWSLRALLVGVMGYVSSLVGGWLLAGGRLVDLGSWLRDSLAVAGGYADAMYAGPVSSPVLLVAAGLALVCVGTVGAQARASWGIRGLGWSGWCAVLLATGLLTVAFKQGFTREDRDHVAALLSAVVVIASRRAPAVSQRLVRVGLVGVALALLAVTAQAATQRPARAGWMESARLVLDGDERAAAVDRAARDVRRAYDVSPHLVGAAGDRPVVVDPFETSAVWAYGLRPLALPVPQPYSAYTPDLDRRNARALLSEPEAVVLREEAVVDDRLQLWDTPDYNLAMVCHFREFGRDDRWTLLGRTVKRCGPAAGVGTTRVEAGEPVALPDASPGELLTMRFVPDDRPLGRRLLAAALKDPHPLQARVGGGGAWHRLPRGLAGGPLVVALPASVTWPAEESRPAGESVTFSERGTVRFEARAFR